MNRMSAIALVAILCLSILCSCYDKTSFTPQDGIEMNYNNISAYNNFWLTDDAICYLEDNLLQYYCLLNIEKKSIIASNGGFGSGKVQRYGNKIYLLDETESIDEENSCFELKCFDVETQKTVSICSLNNCDNFLILDDALFYLEYKWTDNGRVKSLKQCRYENNNYEVIRENVLSFGVIDNSLFYLAEENGCLALCQFEEDKEQSSKYEERNLSIDILEKYKENVKVCYTADNLLISWTDYHAQISKIYVQSLYDDSCFDLEVKGCIDKFVSYENKTYYMVSSDESKYSTLYMFDNEQKDSVELAQILGQGSMFVGSDEGVYILEYSDNVLRYYSYEQPTKTVCKF